MASRDPQADSVDFFPTPPWGARAGAEIIRQMDPRARSVWEPACGAGHMAHGLRDNFATVHASDAYLYDGNVVHDFLGAGPDPFGPVDWIVTNPPFDPAEAFVRAAYARAERGVAMLLRTGCLEGQARHRLLYRDCPLTVVAPFSERLPMHKGRYSTETSTAAFYSWFIWLKPALRPQRFMVRWPDGQWRPGVRDIPPGTMKRLFRRPDLAFAVGGDALMVQARLKAEGHAVGGPLFDLLAKVARDGGQRGVTPHLATYPGGLLATLKGMGLLEQTERDALGDARFRPSADGRAVLRGRA